jgi:hypothetical protein
MAINPDLICEGDEVTLQDTKGHNSVGHVVLKRRYKLTVEVDGDYRSVVMGARRSPLQIVGHQPRLV